LYNTILLGPGNNKKKCKLLALTRRCKLLALTFYMFLNNCWIHLIYWNIVLFTKSNCIQTELVEASKLYPCEVVSFFGSFSVAKKMPKFGGQKMCHSYLDSIIVMFYIFSFQLIHNCFQSLSLTEHCHVVLGYTEMEQIQYTRKNMHIISVFSHPPALEADQLASRNFLCDVCEGKTYKYFVWFDMLHWFCWSSCCI
jgi:hypothetical protein